MSQRIRLFVAACVLLAPVTAFAGVSAVPVPEPQTLGLFALAVGALAFVKFRRRK